VQNLPVTFILIVITLCPQRPPGIFKHDVLQALKEIIGHPGPAVLRPFSLPLLGVKHDLFHRSLLGIQGTGQKETAEQ
jgi:hypothetical protein